MKKLRYFIFIVFLSFSCTLNALAEENTLENNLYIVAVNPGYTVSGKSDHGEMVKLRKLSDNSLSLAGVSLVYIDPNEATYTLYEFENGDEMTGESLLIKYKKAPDATEGTFDAVYNARSLVQSGGILKLVKNNETIDEICWGSVRNCATPKFTSGSKTTLVRDLTKIGTSDEFSFSTDNFADFDPDNPSLVTHDEEPAPQCRSLRFSEIFTYYESSKTEQFVEIFNDGDEQALLNGCSLRYKNKTYPLSGIVLAQSYFTRFAEEFSFTKNPTTSNKVELVDVDGAVVDSLVYYNGQKKGVSFAQFGYDNFGREQWLLTYNVTPNEENVYQKWKTCTDGKVINEETGNCVKETTADTTLEACPAGKYRNPLTNRCKSYASTTTAKELKPCAEGYERNPETNRCRKVKTNTGADYAIREDSFEEKSNFVAIWAIVGVSAVGVGYILFQYRNEIFKLFRKK